MKKADSNVEYRHLSSSRLDFDVRCECKLTQMGPVTASEIAKRGAEDVKKFEFSSQKTRV